MSFFHFFLLFLQWWNLFLVLLKMNLGKLFVSWVIMHFDLFWLIDNLFCQFFCLNYFHKFPQFSGVLSKLHFAEKVKVYENPSTYIVGEKIHYLNFISITYLWWYRNDDWNNVLIEKIATTMINKCRFDDSVNHLWEEFFSQIYETYLALFFTEVIRFFIFFVIWSEFPPVRFWIFFMRKGSIIDKYRRLSL